MRRKSKNLGNVNFYVETATENVTTPNKLHLLTTKQRRFMACLAKYRSFKEVAEKLRISQRQVYRYQQNIYRRLRGKRRKPTVGTGIRANDY